MGWALEWLYLWYKEFIYYWRYSTIRYHFLVLRIQLLYSHMLLILKSTFKMIKSTFLFLFRFSFYCILFDMFFNFLFSIVCRFLLEEWIFIDLLDFWILRFLCDVLHNWGVLRLYLIYMLLQGRMINSVMELCLWLVFWILGSLGSTFSILW